MLFSGGQDSATCLAWALEHYERVETLGFNYGQRHHVELQQRPALIAAMQASCTELLRGRTIQDTVLNVPTITEIGDTAMTSDVEITMGANGLPTTFVPARNLLFLTFAGALAYRRGIKHIVTGVCETDYSGYPDCRDDTIKALQVALNLGMDCRLVLHAAHVRRQGQHVEDGQVARWSRAGASHRRALAFVLRRRSNHSPRLRLRLRPLPGLRAAAKRLATLARAATGAAVGASDRP